VVDGDPFRSHPGLTRAHSRVRAVRARIAQLQAALGAYQLDTGQFLTEQQGLEALRTDPGVEGWHGPYLQKEIPRDRGARLTSTA